MKARKRFGQHFLVDEEVIDRICASIALRREDRVVEIGPGRAALTKPLYDSVDQLTLVELDRDLVPFLKAQFGNAQVVNADVLRVKFAELGPAPMRVVGNLPYNISSPLILSLLGQLDVIRDMHFMLQKEMASRISAGPGSKAWGRLSVHVQHACDVEVLFDVPPTAFSPPPKVQSSVVRLMPKARRLEITDRQAFDRVVRSVFSGRRKRLGNSLKPLVDGIEWDWDKLSVTEGNRAEQVTLEDFVSLGNQLAAFEERKNS